MAAYEWQSDFARKYVGIGREQAREMGRLQQAARSILLMLRARDLPVSYEARARITSRTDLATLRKWVRRAVTVERAEDLFD